MVILYYDSTNIIFKLLTHKIEMIKTIHLAINILWSFHLFPSQKTLIILILQFFQILKQYFRNFTNQKEYIKLACD